MMSGDWKIELMPRPLLEHSVAQTQWGRGSGISSRIPSLPCPHSTPALTPARVANLWPPNQEDPKAQPQVLGCKLPKAATHSGRDCPGVSTFHVLTLTPGFSSSCPFLVLLQQAHAQCLVYPCNHGHTLLQQHGQGDFLFDTLTFYTQTSYPWQSFFFFF